MSISSSSRRDLRWRRKMARLALSKLPAASRAARSAVKSATRIQFVTMDSTPPSMSLRGLERMPMTPSAMRFCLCWPTRNMLTVVHRACWLTRWPISWPRTKRSSSSLRKRGRKAPTLTKASCVRAVGRRLIAPVELDVEGGHSRAPSRRAARRPASRTRGYCLSVARMLLKVDSYQGLPTLRDRLSADFLRTTEPRRSWFMRCMEGCSNSRGSRA